MGGNTIKSIDQILDLLQIALQSGNIDEAQKQLQQINSIDFTSIDTRKLPTILQQIDYIIDCIEKEKKKKAEALQQQESLKKYRF
ncbi:hypothetical protein [Nitratiruptor tergarcus]|uniref:Uncharacterized protein n=1 Tax=Nitratiruptor tergarcus DSM 16512 TaxID=1069081 RepID=A0A1W1WUA3_9BACT|nr:hypothetical protein [Nitratiruptor tergarcus]SMC09313.1 hypothetical protein SAMN05660197_1119 [Nitratiruptor tergarcus DSM 16512]